MSARVLAKITHETPWGALPDDPALAPVTSHVRAEQAITMGLWPFVCPYCGDKFATDRGSFPYCSPICGINAENS